MIAGLPVLGVGQNPQNQPANQPTQAPVDNSVGVRTAPATAVSGIAVTQNEASSEDTSNQLPQIPALLGGIGITPAFITELERSNYLRGGVNVGAAYDDNPLLTPGGSVGNGSVSVFPNISVEQTFSRLRWSLGYAGGLTINQRFTSQNQGSHNLNFDSQYRLSPHVNLRVAEGFSLTTGFFDAGVGAQPVATAGGPNTSLIVPLATERASHTTVETNYHFALNDLVGASGSFYDLHFSNVPGQSAVQLENSQTATGSAFWLHHIFRSDWAGLSYRFERLAFDGGETRVHSFFAVDTLNVAKRFTLNIFAGPQYAENQVTIVNASQTALEQSNNWAAAGGIEGGWQNLRTNLMGGYSRTVSDGGGILGAVRLQNVYGAFRRELVPGWTVALNANHGSNLSLIVPSATSANSIRITSAGVALERNVGRSIGLRVGYSHDFQQELFLGSNPTLDAHRNRAFITLSYEWAKPLGM